MSGSKGVFVIIKAANCGVCTGRLEPLMPVIYKRFKDEGFDIVEYKIDDMKINKDKNGKPVYPESLGLIWWYPFMFFTDSKTLEAIKRGEDHRKDIKIVNGGFGGETYVLEEKDPINFLDPNILINWVKSVSSAAPVMSSSLASPPRQQPREPKIDSNPFLPSNDIKKNILEINYCSIKIVPKCGRS